MLPSFFLISKLSSPTSEFLFFFFLASFHNPATERRKRAAIKSHGSNDRANSLIAKVRRGKGTDFLHMECFLFTAQFHHTPGIRGQSHSVSLEEGYLPLFSVCMGFAYVIFQFFESMRMSEPACLCEVFSFDFLN